MGMPVTVQIVEDSAEEAVVDEVFEELRLMDRLFSPFIDDSEVSQINRGELAIEDSDPLVRQALELSHLYELETGGYFSVWLGGRLDPSGLVKGWAIDRGCAILDRRGYRNFFIDAGGDCQTRGTNQSGLPWRVGIRHPVERDKFARVVHSAGLAVATSGTYEKGDHILDPRTGLPADEFLSMTVVGPDIVAADVYATACFAMGSRGLDFIEARGGYEAFAISRDLSGTWTSGFQALCAPV